MEHVTPTPEKNSPLPLSWAAKRGHIGAVGVLAEPQRANPDMRRQTPPAKQNLHRLPRSNIGQLSSGGRKMRIQFLSQVAAIAQYTFPQLSFPSHPEILTFTTMVPHPTNLSVEASPAPLSLAPHPPLLAPLLSFLCVLLLHIRATYLLVLR